MKTLIFPSISLFNNSAAIFLFFDFFILSRYSSERIEISGLLLSAALNISIIPSSWIACSNTFKILWFTSVVVKCPFPVILFTPTFIPLKNSTSNFVCSSNILLASVSAWDKAVASAIKSFFSSSSLEST